MFAGLLVLLTSLCYAQVTSVFGRNGDVTASPGDYTAAQVTNAVDSTQSYGDPNWLSSLDWSKITNAPLSVAGSNNVAVGRYALFSNISGMSDSAVGHVALYYNTSGYENTAVGDNALLSNTTGFYNTAVGAFAGAAITTGLGNTAVGDDALLTVSTGSQNTGLGHRALLYTKGSYNTAVGGDSQVYNDGGSFNTTLGHDAMVGATNSCTDGFNHYSGSYNTAIGQSSFCTVTTGNNNTLLGWQSGFLMTSGSNNVMIGYQAGTTASQGNANISGYNNTFVGYQSGPGAPAQLNNATAIGADAVVSQSNSLVLGGIGVSAVNVGIGTTMPTNVLTIGPDAGHAIADGWDTYSSRRWKTNIETLHDALVKVEQLRGVSYDLKASGKHEVGVIAEEVGQVVPEVVSWNKDGKQAEGVDYGRLAALLIEATKEQQVLIHQQQEQIRAEQQQIREQQAQITAQQAQIAAQQAQTARLASQVTEIQTALKAMSQSETESRVARAQPPSQR
jgi:hypothetical protein